MARLGGLAVDLDKPGIDEFLDTGAGQFGTMRSDKAVEARSGVGGRRQKLDRGRSHAGIVAGDEEVASGLSCKPFRAKERRVPEWE